MRGPTWSWLTASRCSPTRDGPSWCPTRRTRSRTSGRRDRTRPRPRTWWRPTSSGSPGCCPEVRAAARPCGPVWSPPMNIPEDLRYSPEHEWVRLEGTRARVGITDYDQDALGDIVFVDLPAVGSAVEVGGQLGEVESTKSVSEIYAPVAGTVTAVNDTLTAGPGKINTGRH